MTNHRMQYFTRSGLCLVQKGVVDARAAKGYKELLEAYQGVCPFVRPQEVPTWNLLGAGTQSAYGKGRRAE